MRASQSVATLYQAFKSYQRFLEHEYHRVEDDQITAWGRIQVRQVTTLMQHHSDQLLVTLDGEAVDELFAYWRRRPCKLGTKSPMTAKSCSNYLGALTRFLKWLHKSRDFDWKKPEDFGELDTRVKRLPSDDAKKSLRQVETFSLDELRLLMRYAPFMPHTPHTPPARLFEKYKAKGVHERIAKYYAMCEWFDETCGALVNHIDESGIKENTLVLYVCDNGWIQTEQGGYAPRSKRSPNEFGTRTPIMFRWPGTIPAADRPELCSSIDFVPTVLAAAGATGPHEFPGLNLLPELKSGKAIERDTLYGESFAHDIADIENPQASLLYRWVIRGHDKLLLTYDGAPGKMKYPPQSGKPQLYDLKGDPYETKNLAQEKPELVRELSKLLDEWYIPNERQVGKFAPAAAPKPVRKPKKRTQSKFRSIKEGHIE